MKIRNVTLAEIEAALEVANEKFDGNILFKRLDRDGKTRQGAPKNIVTLTVKDSSGKGGRYARSGRRVAAACWHAHGTFMDSLPEYAEIVSSWTGQKTRPGDPWVDFNQGSKWRPFYASRACNCKGAFDHIPGADVQRIDL